MDVSKLKECFLSIAAAALLHAGAAEEMANRRETPSRMHFYQGKPARRQKMSPRKSRPLKLNVIECHAHGCHMATALPHLLAFLSCAQSGWPGQVCGCARRFRARSYLRVEREMMRPRILKILAELLSSRQRSRACRSVRLATGYCDQPGASSML